MERLLTTQFDKLKSMGLLKQSQKDDDDVKDTTEGVDKQLESESWLFYLNCSLQ